MTLEKAKARYMVEQYTWITVCSQKAPLCPECLILLEEEKPLARKFKLLSEGVAVVLWSCPQCDFRKKAEFRYKADDESADLGFNENIVRQIAAQNRNVAAPDIGKLQSYVSIRPGHENRRPRGTELKASEPDSSVATEEDAIRLAYPNAISGDELFKLLDHWWSPKLGSKQHGRWAERSIERSSTSLGTKGTMEDFVVSYTLDGDEIFRVSYSNIDGIPPGLEDDLRNAKNAFKAFFEQPGVSKAATAPRSPRTYPGMGVSITGNEFQQSVTYEKQSDIPGTGPAYHAPGKL